MPTLRRSLAYCLRYFNTGITGPTLHINQGGEPTVLEKRLKVSPAILCMLHVFWNEKKINNINLHRLIHSYGASYKPLIG